ncbi:hypothetical protein DZF91_31970 [Actinomadura logoneensis]|uniref:Secreted protein n=1 Tax=Actinomadura logoneensis TaxID=2293572 RepID=A0A372JC80_9ACTN|nr:hypothetical protein [Actinomadura logoneensis]RFU37617.1 hypothetical protein DZF91_31970 [Actinomadura logoneensis]
MIRTRIAATLTAAVAVLAAALPGTAAADTLRLGPWKLTGSESRPSATSNQGLATVRGRGLYFTGNGTVPDELRAAGWGHVGDPDSARGYVFDAYQWTAADPAAKMFLVTTPGGARYRYVHPLAPGELMNNSYAAVTPDGRWMVSGEWGTMDRLLVLPTPVLNPRTPRTGGTLPLAGRIRLDRPVRDVQGCDFVTATSLICATDDTGTDLFPTTKQLLRITLSAPLRGRDVTGRVASLGQLPLVSDCQGEFETEGVDYDPATGRLRVAVVPPSPCDVNTTIHTFRR